MSGQFEKDYFTRDSIYAKFAGAAQAVELTARWYYSLFHRIQRVAQFDLKDRRVIDVGCGYPGMLSLFCEAGANCVGLDVSEFVIECNRVVLPKAQFHVGDAQHLGPSLLGKYDLVLSLEVIEHVPNVDSFLDTVVDLIAPGGYLVLTTPNRHGKVPGYRWDTDPTHISVMAMSDWRKKVQRRNLNQLISETFITVPFVWKYTKRLNFTVLLKDIGPSCLIVAQKKA